MRDYWKIPYYINDLESSLGRYIDLCRFEFIWKFFTVLSNSFGDPGDSQDSILPKKRKRK